MSIYQLGNKKPKFLGTNNFIANTAAIIGDATIGNNVSIWFGNIIRADLASITICDNSNVQDNCVFHVDYGYPIIVKENVTIGHAAVVHGCFIGENTLIGINAVILNGAKIGKNCIIGANSLITQGKVIPDNSIVMGSPGKVIRPVSADEIAQIKATADFYVQQIKVYKDLRVI